MATAATTNSKTREVNHIHRPVAEDVLAQQPKMKRNQQLGQQTKSRLQIDKRLLINRFLGQVPLTGLGLLGDKSGQVTCRDLVSKYDIIHQDIQFLYGRWVIIQIISPPATPDRNFLTLFDIETYELLDCVEIVCYYKYCVYNKITSYDFADGGYLAFKICSHINMDAMTADKDYSKRFLENGFQLDEDEGLYGHRTYRSRGKDHTTPPPRPQLNINSRWDAMVFYINPDFKFRELELPRTELPYELFDHGSIKVKVMKPSTGTRAIKLLVGLSVHNKNDKLIIYDHSPASDTPSQIPSQNPSQIPSLNTSIYLNGDGIVCKTNDRYYTTYERYKNDDDNEKYIISIKSFDILRPGILVHEEAFVEQRVTDSSDKYKLMPDGRIEMLGDLYRKHKQQIGFSEYKQFDYTDFQGSELVIFNPTEPQKRNTGDTHSEYGYEFQVINNLQKYTISAGNIYKYALLKSLSASPGIFITILLDSPSPKEIMYSPDGRFLAVLFNSEEHDSNSSNMQGVLLFEKTPHSMKWREIGYVSFTECRRFFGMEFISSGDDELGYNLMVSGGSKSGKDLVYLPDELAQKYYSRLSQPGVMLGPSDITIRQMSGFLAYNRMRFQELRDGT